ncbi:Dual specificity protein phosphatase [Halosimplex carlsbadense 2-9-1]|uniref:Dual specificity protein phosphatase n=1 Tax=Halosimplex carlsbadense 2-9-1 TaxID=797114 RepID=M0CM57_9EURY|nr:dual specificity protein phosphatase family protein [Halosimplex carlsbadense]ELZ24336.1 Dual specificity protein phosphatase [Halosimplex carlsbadense 2-9-1]
MPGTNRGNDGPDWWRHGEAVVRPFGYEHDRPIARRVGERDLFVGNAAAAASPPGDPSVEWVLSLTAEPRPATTHHRPLVDGPDNEWTAFEAAADAACRLLGESAGALLIHCSHGVSRSAAVAAVAVAVAEGRSLRSALSDVQSARPPAQPHPALHEQAVCYLAKR